RLRHHRLTGADVEREAVVLDLNQTLEHDGVLGELRPLARLAPAARRTHVCDADIGALRVDAADVLVDELRPGARRGDTRRGSDQTWHRNLLARICQRRGGVCKSAERAASALVEIHHPASRW